MGQLGHFGLLRPCRMKHRLSYHPFTTIDSCRAPLSTIGIVGGLAPLKFLSAVLDRQGPQRSADSWNSEAFCPVNKGAQAALRWTNNATTTQRAAPSSEWPGLGSSSRGSFDSRGRSCPAVARCFSGSPMPSTCPGRDRRPTAVLRPTRPMGPLSVNAYATQKRRAHNTGPWRQP